jgi:hypothetical protein
MIFWAGAWLQRLVIWAWRGCKDNGKCGVGATRPASLIGLGRKLQRLVIWPGAQLQIHWEEKVAWRVAFALALALTLTYKVYL